MNTVAWNGIAGAAPAQGGETATQTITVDEIKAQAAAYLAAELPWDQDHLNLTVNYTGRNIEAPQGKIDWLFQMPEKQTGQFPLGLTLSAGPDFRETLRLIASVKVMQDVVRAKRSIPRGQVLTENDLEVVRENSARAAYGALTRLEDAVGLEANRPLGIGQTVTFGMVGQPLLVKSGDHILIIAEKGAMKITAPGIAKDKGSKGAVIAVENTQTKKVVYGEIIDANTIHINF